MKKDIHSIFNIKKGERADDLNAGIGWLIDNGCLEQKERKPENAIFLTEKGYSAM
jgi:hypothetical protein